MSYWFNHLGGSSTTEPLFETFPALYDKLAHADGEHTDVCLAHESEWGLSAFKDGLLVWENLAEGDGPRHMAAVPREKVLELWERLAAGDIEAVEREPWLPGYGISRS
jgi:hypothetical protein